ncbi:DUF4136 domain-containing protein, partial [Streptomyces albidoflavus]
CGEGAAVVGVRGGWRGWVRGLGGWGGWGVRRLGG